MVHLDTNIQRHCKVLNLPFPFTEDELKHAFREQAFKTHPDQGGDEESFKTVFTAFQNLKGYAEVIRTDEKQMTADGYALSSFGKGLDDTVNSKTCERCNGQGFQQETHFTYSYDTACDTCGGVGSIGLEVANYSDWRFFYRKTCQRCQA